MSKHKTTKHKDINLPQAIIPSKSGNDGLLPFNGCAVKEGMFAFSFACFSQGHELFNLGGKAEDGTVGGRWFIELMNCLKSVSTKTISELRRSVHELHPIDWSATNTPPPNNNEQLEYWQFRINKSRGRVIGFLIDSVFYVVWLDPHHNLTNSEGYGGVDAFKRPKSEYEIQEDKILELKAEVESLRLRLKEHEELLELKTKPN